VDKLDEFEQWTKILPPKKVQIIKDAITRFRAVGVLKTSKEWAEQEDTIILDPDGWRTNNIYGERFKPCDFDTTPITSHEFFRRKILSTCFSRKTKDEK
jgi:hypothetical protein